MILGSHAQRKAGYNYEVALGKHINATTWNKFGYNQDVDTGGEETVWSPSGLFQRMSSADTLNIVSSSTNDANPSGTGARGVVIYGVNENRESQTEVVFLNGTTPVTTTNQWLGVNRVSVFSAGSGQQNAGTITVTDTTGGTTQAEMPATQGTTQQAIFFTQAGYTALMDFLYINVNKVSGGGSPRITIKGYVFSAVSNAEYEVYRTTIDTNSDNIVQITPPQPFVVGEKSIVEFRASSDTNNSIVSIRFSLIEVKTDG